MRWAKLGDVCEISGAGVDKKKVPGEKEVTLLNYLDVYRNQYLDNSTATMVVTASDKKIAQCDAKRGDIFITPSSETVDDIFRSAVVIEDLQNTVYSYHVLRLRLKEPNFITSCYLNHLFQCEVFRPAVYKLAYGNTRQFVPKGDLENLKIPVPPLEVQRKIAEQLDLFEALISSIRTEKTLRTKQLRYYSELLLKSEHLGDFEWHTLGDILKIKVGGDKPKNDISEAPNEVQKYKVLSNGTAEKAIAGYTSKAVVFGESISISARGTIGYLMFHTEPYFPIVRLLCLSVKDEMKDAICLKFIYYFLTTCNFNYVETGIPSLTTDKIIDIKIPVPNLETQRKIAGFLDTIAALIAALERELELRSKQARYYKEELLNFAKDQL